MLKYNFVFEKQLQELFLKLAPAFCSRPDEESGAFTVNRV
jgi:hypothetical protein